MYEKCKLGIYHFMYQPLIVLSTGGRGITGIKGQPGLNVQGPTGIKGFPGNTNVLRSINHNNKLFVIKL